MPHPAISPNSVAVITGGASGIGLAAATRFAASGMKVCIADIGADRLAEAATKLSSVAPDGGASIMTETVDVSRIDDVSRLEAAVQKRFGGTDILMNNAGIQPGSQIFGRNRELAAHPGRQFVGHNPWIAGVCAAHDRARPAGPHHQHRLETGHHHAARRSRL